MTIQKFEVPDWIRSVLICDPTDIWGNVVGMGLAELAAALTPAKRTDRRGSVVRIDSFENGLAQCEVTTSGAGASVNLSSEEANFGGLCAKLTGGSSYDRTADIFYCQSKLRLSKFGLEFQFRVGLEVEYIWARVCYYDGVQAHDGRIRYNIPDSKYEYLNSAGSWADLLTGVTQPIAEKAFFAMKLVIDPENDLYTRALVYGEEKDMSSYGLYVFDSAIAPRSTSNIQVKSNLGQNGWSYVDSVVITEGEPA